MTSEGDSSCLLSTESESGERPCVVKSSSGKCKLRKTGLRKEGFGGRSLNEALRVREILKYFIQTNLLTGILNYMMG